MCQQAARVECQSPVENVSTGFWKSPSAKPQNIATETTTVVYEYLSSGSSVIEFAMYAFSMLASFQGLKRRNGPVSAVCTIE